MAYSYCSRCGSALLPNAQFCSKCGAAIVPPARAPSPAAPPYPTAPGYGSAPGYGLPPGSLPTYPPPASAAEEAPTAAGILSIIGGVFILLGGIAEAAVGSLVVNFTLGQAGGALIGLGVLGVILGILILIFGILLLRDPDNNITYGVLILIFSLVSLASFFGGFVIGFLLALIGAILALTWKPYGGPVYVYQSTPPSSGV